MKIIPWFDKLTYKFSAYYQNEKLSFLAYFFQEKKSHK